MKVFTDEFKEWAVDVAAGGVIVLIFLLIFGIVGGIEQGVIWRV